MPAPMYFDIVYERALLKRTLNCYLRDKLDEGLGASGLLAILAVAVALVWLIWTGNRSILVAILAGLFPLLLVIAVSVYLGWHRLLDRQLADMRSPVARVTLHDEDIAVAADTGVASIKWRLFSEIREYPDCWLLVMQANRFVSLPLKGVPPEALDFIRAKIPAARKAAEGSAA